jgi:molybdopterin-guanine dinucleotide biosynthesis protein A
VTVSAIVLAGGRSERFGREKLAEPIAGRSLLAHAVSGVAAVADEVIVVLAPHAPEPSLAADVTFARDPEPHQGPLIGLLAGLRVATGHRAIVIGGDMPTPDPEVLRLLLDGLGQAAASALSDGRDLRPLPLALVRDPALEAAARLTTSGERRLRGLLAALDALAVPEAAWRTLDPSARTLHDIDVPSDLESR